MPTETRARFNKVIVPGLFAMAREQFKRYDETWKKVVTVKGSKRAYEESAYMSGLGYFFEKPEGQAIDFDARIQGPSKKWVHTTYALALRITDEAIEDDLYSVMRSGTKDMAVSAQATRHILGIRPFMTGNATTYHTAGDGLTLFATNHVLLNGGTYSNLAAAAATPTEAAVTAAVRNFENITDHRGKRYSQKARGILSGPYWEFTLSKILGSTLEPDTANNAINALIKQRKLALHIDGEITDDRWFVFGEKDPDTGIIAFERRKPTMRRAGDPDTGDAKFYSSFRFSIEGNDPRQYYMTPPA